MEKQAVEDMVLEQDRDYWRERAHAQQIRAIMYKLLFLLCFGFILGKWML